MRRRPLVRGPLDVDDVVQRHRPRVAVGLLLPSASSLVREHQLPALHRHRRVPALEPVRCRRRRDEPPYGGCRRDIPPYEHQAGCRRPTLGERAISDREVVRRDQCVEVAAGDRLQRISVLTQLQPQQWRLRIRRTSTDFSASTGTTRSPNRSRNELVSCPGRRHDLSYRTRSVPAPSQPIVPFVLFSSPTATLPSSSPSGSTAGPCTDTLTMGCDSLRLGDHRDRLREHDREPPVRRLEGGDRRARHVRRHLPERRVHPDQDVRAHRRPGRHAVGEFPVRRRRATARRPLAGGPGPDLRPDRPDRGEWFGVPAPPRRQRQRHRVRRHRPVHRGQAADRRQQGRDDERVQRGQVRAGRRQPADRAVRFPASRTSATTRRTRSCGSSSCRAGSASSAAASWPPSSPTSSRRTASTSR